MASGRYDSGANGQAESAIQDTERGMRCLLHQAGAPISLWDEAAPHYTGIFNFSRTNVDKIEDEIEPMIADRRLGDRLATVGFPMFWVFSQRYIVTQSWILWASLGIF